MKLTRGLNFEGRSEDQPEGTYPYGKNGIQAEYLDSIINEPGFKKVLQDLLPTQYKVNGVLGTDTDEVIIFATDNVNTVIKRVNTLTKVVSFTFEDSTTSYKLGHKVENYITGQVQRNYLGEMICAFTDKNTFPKFINFDNPQIAQLRDWNLFPECIYPSVYKFEQVGGYIQVGSYFFAGRYYKSDGTRTSFSEVSSGIAITSNDSDNIADKSIVLQYSSMDLGYEFFEPVVISKVLGVTKAYLLKKIPVLPGTNVVTFSGDNIYEEISLEEVLTSQVFYDKVGSITQLNDSLYLGKLEKTAAVLDMQPYANLVKIALQSELIDVENAPLSMKNGTKKSLKHNEVYGFYIKYKLSNGTKTIAYHVPGEAMDPAYIATSAIGTAGGLGVPKYKVEDCITTFSSSSNIVIPGSYENDTELYPIVDTFDSSSLGGDDLRGQKVRHHKTPSLKWCKENLYSTEVDYGTKKLDILGAKAFNIIIPPKYQNIIVGYEILYAKRTIQNMTNYGQGLLLYSAHKTNTGWTVVTDPNSRYSLGHNWQIAGAGAGYSPNENWMRFHGFDVLFNQPGINPAFIAAQYKLTTDIKNKYLSWSYNTGSSPQDSYGNCCHLLDNIANGTASSAPTNNIRGLQDTLYLNNDVTSGNHINQYMEKVFVGTLLGTPFPFTVQAQDTSSQGNFSTITPTSEAYLIDLCDIKPNVYENFYNQELVSMGDSVLLSSNATFWGGDIFVCEYSFHTYGIMDDVWNLPYDDGTHIAGPDMRGRRVINRIACESVANLYTRYEIVGNDYSKWHPKFPVPDAGSFISWPQYYPVLYSGYVDPNQFGYSKGSEAINDFTVDDIYNPYRVYQTKFPYRIHRGGKLSRQYSRSWRTFLALDFYEVQKNMGFIEHLEGMDDRLLIHCTNALFVTQDKTKLESGLLSITLGTGDIFQFEPQEVQSAKQGFAGTQHDLACIKTPLGYLFPDAKQGEIYLYKNKDLKLLNDGIHRFLREFLAVVGKNPFTGNGVTIAWDQKYKRFIATVKNLRPVGNPAPISITNESQILDVINIVGPPNYSDVLVTDQGNVYVGDVILLYGRPVVYKGINNVTAGATSDYDCAADEEVCDPVEDLTIIESGDPPFASITWAASASNNYLWILYEVTATGLVQVQSQTTNFNILTLDDSVLDSNKVYYFQVFNICSDGILSSPTVGTFSIPTPVIIIPPPSGGSTNIMYHPYKVPVPLHPGGCGTSNTSDATKYDLIVNGVTLGTNLSLSYTACTNNPFTGTWIHGVQVGPSQVFATSGSLTSATVKMVLKNSGGSAATIAPGALNPVPMYTTALVAVPGVIGGAGNNEITWTGVDISPSFTSYVHLYFF
ncbi:MAG: hypothetical protein EKK63_14665 [Acinetobacter sp.]|uniref:hypothetical protein n=1 Tax=Acinetobacter sp. TaxID=472 RepID=UPI000FA68FC6|nr:hypothetical protein [Acinetobacter sp.]RUP37508.1 MAG: hypothetical protein EKK63_14665 [Acinetobacter sp.]